MSYYGLFEEESSGSYSIIENGRFHCKSLRSLNIEKCPGDKLGGIGNYVRLMTPRDPTRLSVSHKELGVTVSLRGKCMKNDLNVRLLV